MKQAKRKHFKSMAAFLSCIALIFSVVMPASAANYSEPTDSVSYDLSVGGTQTFHFTDKDGNESIVTVTELESTERVANGTYKIEYTKRGFWTAGYKITVSGNRITSAYGKYATLTTGSISDESLRVDSSKQATYQFTHHYLGIPFTSGVRCKLENDKITVSRI